LACLQDGVQSLARLSGFVLGYLAQSMLVLPAPCLVLYRVSLILRLKDPKPGRRRRGARQRRLCASATGLVCLTLTLTFTLTLILKLTLTHTHIHTHTLTHTRPHTYTHTQIHTQREREREREREGGEAMRERDGPGVPLTKTSLLKPTKITPFRPTETTLLKTH